MLENCHILDDVIVQNHAVEGVLVCKTIASGSVSFIVTNHRLAQSDIELKSILSLEPQSPETGLFPAKNNHRQMKNNWN